MTRLPADFFSWCDRESDAGRMADVDRGLLERTFRSLASDVPEEETFLVLLLVGILSRARREGHVLVDLDEVFDHPWMLSWRDRIPDPARWEDILRSCPLVTRPGGVCAPFLYEARSLYFYALYREEAFLARSVRNRLSAECAGPDDRERALLRKHAGGEEMREKLLEGALFRPFFLLTGGPGTGKTRTSAQILEVLRILRPGAHAVVAAPTGKAARRFSEALSLPDIEVLTLHRLLGMTRQGFSRGSGQMLSHDLVLVDECSMVDLSLMARLFRSIAPETAVVLVGDRNQLSSVGPGSVFGDLAQALEARMHLEPGVSSSFHVLTKNFRQDRWEDFGKLSEGIRQGDVRTVLEVLSAGGGEGAPIVWVEPRTGSIREMGKSLIESWLPVVGSRSVEEAWRGLGAFALLGAIREGPLGTRTVNRLLWRHFENRSGFFRRFLPVIVTENSPETGLMNGDLGLLETEGKRFVRAYFPGSGEAFRAFSPALLPPWEAAFALTVHKSQGSEFDRVTVLLGQESNPVLTRSLLYTAVTRARRQLTIYAGRALLREALGNAGWRSSGLVRALWETDGGPDELLEKIPV